MDLSTLLLQNRDAVLSDWRDRIIESYPEATVAFLSKQKDRFRNPVGHSITDNIGKIYEQIAGSMDVAVLGEALDRIIRIRSVQQFTPSAAVGFIFALKPVLRQSLADQIPDLLGPEELSELDSRVDRVALVAFDTYTRCRESLHEARINEIRGRSMRLMEWANRRPVESRAEGGSIDEGV